MGSVVTPWRSLRPPGSRGALKRGNNFSGTQERFRKVGGAGGGSVQLLHNRTEARRDDRRRSAEDLAFVARQAGPIHTKHPRKLRLAA